MMNPDHKLGLLSNPDMTIAEALEVAFIALGAVGSREAHDAATIIKAIHEQRGLDDGSGIHRDILTDILSEYVFG